MSRVGALSRTAAITLAVSAFVTGAHAGSQTPPASQTPSKLAADPTVGAPGPDCLDLHMIDRTEVIDDSTIIFHMKGKKSYISKLPFRCHGLKFEEGFAYSTSINKLCGNVDTIKVLRRGNSCALGAFHEYVAPEKTPKISNPE